MRTESGASLAGNGSSGRDALPLPLPVKNRLSLLPRSDAGNEFCRLRSIRSHPFDPYLRDVRASPSGCFRFGQARMRQASTFFRYGLNGFDGLNGLLPCSAMGLCAWGAVFFWLATEVSAGTALSTPAVASQKTVPLFRRDHASSVLSRLQFIGLIGARRSEQLQFASPELLPKSHPIEHQPIRRAAPSRIHDRFGVRARARGLAVDGLDARVARGARARRRGAREIAAE